MVLVQLVLRIFRRQVAWEWVKRPIKYPEKCTQLLDIWKIFPAFARIIAGSAWTASYTKHANPLLWWCMRLGYFLLCNSFISITNILKPIWVIVLSMLSCIFVILLFRTIKPITLFSPHKPVVTLFTMLSIIYYQMTWHSKCQANNEKRFFFALCIPFTIGCTHFLATYKRLWR